MKSGADGCSRKSGTKPSSATSRRRSPTARRRPRAAAPPAATGPDGRVCDRVCRTTSQSVSPRRRTCPSSSGRSTVYGATGSSRYSAAQQPGSRREIASASGVPAAMPAPPAWRRALPPTWSECQCRVHRPGRSCRPGRGPSRRSARRGRRTESLRAGCLPGSRSVLASGKGRCHQIAQVGSDSGDPAADWSGGRSGPGTHGRGRCGLGACGPGRRSLRSGPRAHPSAPFTRISVCCPAATSFRSPSPRTPNTSSRHTVRVRPDFSTVPTASMWSPRAGARDRACTRR
ncbi:hypothetical protein STANM309S_02709 [Streptomyces tanashiensis]